MIDGVWTDNTFSVEFVSKNGTETTYRNECCCLNFTRGSFVHIVAVNYRHKDWYENHLSIYQHYGVWHAKCATSSAATDQNTSARSRLSRAIIKLWTQHLPDPSGSHGEKDGASQSRHSWSNVVSEDPTPNSPWCQGTTSSPLIFS